LERPQETTKEITTLPKTIFPNAPTPVKELSQETKSCEKERKIDAQKTTEKTISSEDEIDDVEPSEALVIVDSKDEISSKTVDPNNTESSDTPSAAPINTTSRLLAAGVSVSVISRKKSLDGGPNKKDIEKTNESSLGTKKMAGSKSVTTPTSITNTESVKKIGLGSDISVTVVQKKKSIDGDTPATSNSSKPSVGGFLSVKKESELLEAPNKVSKDVVQVHNIIAQSANKSTAISNANHAAAAAAAKAALDAARKSLQQGALRRSIESMGENPDGNGSTDTLTGKNPPDPIVTISKVSGAVGMAGSSANKESLTQQHRDAAATVEKQSRQTTGSSHNTTPPVSSPGINQLSTNSNSGSSSTQRPPSAPTHHVPVSSNPWCS
jgi:hypothetical protein